MYHSNEVKPPKGLFYFVALAVIAAVFCGSRRVGAQTPNDSDAMHKRAATPAVSSPSCADGDVCAAELASPSAGPSDSDFDDSPSNEAAGSAESDDSASSSQDGRVLEVPQVVDLSGGASNGGAANSLSSGADDDDDDAQAVQGGESEADSDDLARAPVGDVQDYEDQAEEAPAAVVVYPGATAVPVFSPQAGLGLPVTPGTQMTSTMLFASPIILPPNSAGPLPSTSPMLMAPRVGMPAHVFPRISFPRGRR